MVVEVVLEVGIGGALGVTRGVGGDGGVFGWVLWHGIAWNVDSEQRLTTTKPSHGLKPVESDETDLYSIKRSSRS